MNRLNFKRMIIKMIFNVINMANYLKVNKMIIIINTINRNVKNQNRRYLYKFKSTKNSKKIQKKN